MKSPIKVILLSFGTLLLVIIWYLIFFSEIRTRDVGSENNLLTEKYYRNAHIRSFKSSIDTSLRLWMVVYLPLQRSYILVTAHGFHGELNLPDVYPSKKEFLSICLEMRGRTHSKGKPDASGYELQDWIDAVNFAKKEYAKYIIDTNIVYTEGGSGAGGNIYAILGKYPDFFTAAAVHSGMSDYYKLAMQDEVYEFVDELEGEGWIGGTWESNPIGYKSRGGLTTVQNLLTPLYIDHGETDIRIPVTHAREYVARARKLNKTIKYIESPDVGDRQHWTNITNNQEKFLEKLMFEWLLSYKSRPEIPQQSSMIVAGFLKTRHFEINLDDIDKIATVDYKFSKDYFPEDFKIYGDSLKHFKLKVRLPDDRNYSINITFCKTYQIVKEKNYLILEVLPKNDTVKIHFSN
jgi:hypothetical protein